MQRAFSPSTVTMLLQKSEPFLSAGKYHRHRHTGDPLAPNEWPISCPKKRASHINTFPACSHRLSSKTACVLLCFCFHNNASFDTVLTRFWYRKSGAFCPTFVHVLWSQKACFLYCHFYRFLPFWKVLKSVVPQRISGFHCSVLFGYQKLSFCIVGSQMVAKFYGVLQRIFTAKRAALKSVRRDHFSCPAAMFHQWPG